MGLCLDGDCKNKSKPGEDYCLQYFNSQKYETDGEEVYQINLKKYSESYMNNILNEFIKNKSKNIIYNIINKNNIIEIKNIVNGYLHENIIYEIVNKNKNNYNLSMIKYNTLSYKDYILNRKILIFDNDTKLIKYPGFKLFLKEKNIWELYDIFNIKFKSYIKHLPYIGNKKLKNIKTIINNNTIFYSKLYNKEPVLYVLYSSNNIYNELNKYINSLDISKEDKDKFDRSILIMYRMFQIVCDLNESKNERDKLYDKIKFYIYVRLKNY